MSVDMNTQVRDYTEFFQEGIEPVEMEEILHRRIGDGPVRPVAPGRATHRRGWVTAAVAALVAVIVLGGVAWLSQSDGEVPPADETPPTTAAVTPTTEAAITTDTVAVTTTTLVAVPIVAPGEGPKLKFVQGESPVDGFHRLGGGLWFDGALYVTSHGLKGWNPAGSGGNTLFRSSDGLTWEPVPGLPTTPKVQRSMLYTGGDRLVNVVMTDSRDFLEVNTSIDGEEWTSSKIQIPMLDGSNMAGELDVDDKYPVGYSVAVGPKGIVVAVTVDLTFEGEGFANGLVGADDGVHVEIIDLDIDRGIMTVRLLDENNDMEQIGDDREVDLRDTGFSTAFSNRIDAMLSDPDWAILVDRFITQLTSAFTDGYSSVSVGYAWHSSNGETWSRIASEGPLDRGEFAAIRATPEGFIATATSTRVGSFNSRRVWESDDGTNWSVANGLTSSHAFDASRLAELQGELVELVYRWSQRGAYPRVFTLTTPPQDLASEIPFNGMVVEIGGLGMIGTPVFQPAESDKMEIILSTDGTIWNRWQPTEFGTVDGRDQAEAWIVGIGDDFVVLQVDEADESGTFSGPNMWIGRIP